MYDLRRDTYTVTISGQLLAMADTNPGAFVTALKQEMEAAMQDHVNSQGQLKSYYIDPQQAPYTYPPVPSVKDAENALKAAKRQVKAAAKAERGIRKERRRRDKDHKTALKALRRVANDESRGYATVEAAKELLNQC